LLPALHLCNCTNTGHDEKSRSFAAGKLSHWNNSRFTCGDVGTSIA
jgi:hypothetical protein